MGKRHELIQLIMSSYSLAEEDGHSCKDYLLGLRGNRAALVADILSNTQTADNSVQSAGLLTKAKNIQNQTRGKLGELLGRVALTQHTTATDADLITDKMIFETPYGQRRIDLYWQSQRVAVETKMGYITNSKNIRNQIRKDAYLIQNGMLDSVMWMLVKSGSKNAKLNLEKHGIAYLQGWPL